MIIVSIEFKESVNTKKFLDEANAVLNKRGFIEINENTFISKDNPESKAKATVEELALLNDYKRKCKSIYYGTVRKK